MKIKEQPEVRESDVNVHLNCCKFQLQCHPGSKIFESLV